MGSRRNRRKRLQKELQRKAIELESIPKNIDQTPHLLHLNSIGLNMVTEILEPILNQKLKHPENSDFYRWQQVLNQLPNVVAHNRDLNTGRVTITPPPEFTAEQQENLQQTLMGFSPWRKGPLSVMGVNIDTEWRSDWKWDRLGLSSLQGERILDIGCGNGYHCLRMLGAGAESVTGIDPSWFSFFQFQAVQHFLQEPRVSVLPLKDLDLAGVTNAFDRVFSMGVLYHQKSPVDHLKQIHSLLTPRGYAVVETLIIESSNAEALYPEQRYAKMRNVSAIPSVALMEKWLHQAGFSEITLLDTTPTTIEEQRSTDWMTFESLSDYLDPQDSSKTIEGYPSPIRGSWLARRES